MGILAKKKINKKAKSEFKVNPVFIVSEMTKRIEHQKIINNGLKSSIKRLYLVMGGLCIGIVILLAMAFQQTDKYFVVDSFGQFIPVHGYESALVTRERRVQHAEYIVRSLNSLSFLNKDKVLKDVKKFFQPEVFNEYLSKQNGIGFFEQIENNNMKYMASIGPARLLSNNGAGVKKTDAECYQDITKDDGTVVPNWCSASSIEMNGHSETYEFLVTREAFANAKSIETVKFKARIKITKSSPKDGVQGYMVSEYSEYR